MLDRLRFVIQTAHLGMLVGRQGTTLTLTMASSTANHGTFSLSDDILTYAPNSNSPDVRLSDTQIEGETYYDTASVYLNDGVNLSRAIADIQKQIVQADQGEQIAERVADAAVKKAGGDAASVKLNAVAEAERTKVLADAEARRIALTGNAEAEKILAIGKANAESYQLQVNAMGGENFTRTKIAEIIGKDKVKVMPDILITGGGDGSTNGALSGLLGMKLMEELAGKTPPPPSPPMPLQAPAKPFEPLV